MQSTTRSFDMGNLLRGVELTLFPSVLFRGQSRSEHNFSNTCNGLASLWTVVKVMSGVFASVSPAAIGGMERVGWQTGRTVPYEETRLVI